MTFPEHPLSLLVSFSLVTFAFVGLGPVIAAPADNVPPQASVHFPPMLIIGGVAVSLALVAAWQHVGVFPAATRSRRCGRVHGPGRGRCASGARWFRRLLFAGRGCSGGMRSNVYRPRAALGQLLNVAYRSAARGVRRGRASQSWWTETPPREGVCVAAATSTCRRPPRPSRFRAPAPATPVAGGALPGCARPTRAAGAARAGASARRR